MAAELTPLVGPNGDPIAPNESDLAFYVAEHGMHGLEDAVPKHIDFWLEQRVIAQTYGEAAREGLANNVLTWLSLGGGVVHYDQLIRLAHARPNTFTPTVVEGLRRMMIGGLAASMAIQRGMAIDLTAEVADGRAMEPSAAADYPRQVIHDFSTEQNEREWPYEPRIHVSLTTAQKPTFGPGHRPTTMWDRLGPELLVCSRYPADVTPPKELQMLDLGVFIDPYRTTSHLPHIIAQDSPLRLA